MDPIDFDVERSAARFLRDPHVERIRAGRSDFDGVLQPLASFDPADVVTAAAIACRLDVDAVGAIGAAGVAGRRVVIGDLFAADVVVLELHFSRKGNRSA